MGRYIKPLVLTIFLLLAISQPVLADMSLPDSTPTISSIHIYRNLLETNDKLIIIYASIPYSTTQNYTVKEAFIWQLLNVDNVTILGSSTGFPFVNKGYGWNVFSFYFPASASYSWDVAYPLRLTGTPSAFDSPPVYNFVIPASAYTLEISTEDNQEALKQLLIDLATDLNIKWSLGASYSLLTEIETGTVFSIYGESCFRGAIYGLQSLCPDIFSMSIVNVTYTPPTWTANYSGNLSSQWAGTWIESSRSASKGMFSATFDIISIVIVFAIIMLVIIANQYLTQDIWAGLIDASIVLIITAKLGMFMFGFLALMACIAWLYLNTRWWGFPR